MTNACETDDASFLPRFTPRPFAVVRGDVRWRFFAIEHPFGSPSGGIAAVARPGTGGRPSLDERHVGVLFAPATSSTEVSYVALRRAVGDVLYATGQARPAEVEGHYFDRRLVASVLREVGACPRVTVEVANVAGTAVLRLVGDGWIGLVAETKEKGPRMFRRGSPRLGKERG